eukprot:TRINITY_DN2428_c0_g1_i1.p1 TRINITY_DN2428_c0_g1~~TRINITY_DN2428_c0_g1_i1.p1  ORF type:complete len:152 (-),score=50.16 TRINITY_DN2428_c0_g1_i1:56-475(-)
MAARALEGDWEFISDKGYDPVKVTIKHMMGPDWMVACMIPKGNMMASMLKKEDGGEGFNLVNFNCSEKKETPQENKELEEDFKVFLAKGISNLVREDKNLIMTAGGEQRILTQDDVLKKQEDAKKAKVSAPRGGGGFRR